ncbi:MAG: exodeoxyribonuclease VII small subunit [Coriobacteriales bacterium]|jgi:exodeoxyribonuclease VII small subunit
MTEADETSKYPDIESMSFKEGMAELDSIVRTLEGDQVELEQGIASYERGVALLGALQKRLDTAEQKVQSLMGELEPEGDDIDGRLS